MFLDQAEKLREMVDSRNSEAVNTTKFKHSKVLAVTSGKGGSGKSNFVTNLAVALSEKKKILIIDADIGLANIEILFGAMPSRSLSDLLSGKSSIEEVIVNVEKNIDLISGGRWSKELIKSSLNIQNKVLNSFSLLDELYDYIIIDTGAGINDVILNFVLSAEDIILVTNPEPTAITDTYAMIKSLKESSQEPLNISVVMNRCEDFDDGVHAFKKLLLVSHRFLNLEIESLGIILYDEYLNKAIRSQRPITLILPNSIYSKGVRQIANRLINEINIDKKRHSALGARNFLKKILNINI